MNWTGDKPVRTPVLYQRISVLNGLNGDLHGQASDRRYPAEGSGDGANQWRSHLRTATSGSGRGGHDNVANSALRDESGSEDTIYAEDRCGPECRGKWRTTYTVGLIKR